MEAFKNIAGPSSLVILLVVSENIVTEITSRCITGRALYPSPESSYCSIALTD